MREFSIVTDPYTVQKIRTQRFSTLKWSPDEQLLKDRPKHVRDFFKKRQVPFRLLCETKFKRSLFGIFLHEHNTNEVQDYFMNDNKLAMLDYDLKSYSENELKHVECENNFAPDLRKLLEKAVVEQEVIDYDFLYDNVYALRFCDTPLTFLDSELKKFRRLKVLILCGNWLTDVPGTYLPKSLEYIELFANQIEYVNNFVKKGPKGLIHIGLKRNWLTNDSYLHLLGKREKFHYLQSLDLSENDIYDLEPVLLPLKELRQLMCLQLQGNPCSVVNCYKDEILRHIPWLDQLDLTEILDVDRLATENKTEQLDGAISFTCHRIMSLPKPTNEKGIDKWYYFSVSMPLLEDVIDVKQDESAVGEEDEGTQPLKKAQVPATKATEATKAKSAPAKKKKGIPIGPYNAPDEYADECKRHVVDTTFKTERFAWDKIMQLPEEALLIKSPERNFADIRDTLRSSVCVKLIYLEVRPPEKSSKKTAKNKSKTQMNKKGKGKGNKSSTDMSSSHLSKELVELTEQPETITKKITLAKFYCDLHSINWSDKTIDFIWAAQEQFRNKAQEVDGSLRIMNYGDKGQTKERKLKKGNRTESDATSMTDASKIQQVKQPIPKIFTIQVGIGLQRTYYQS